jgi:hypothetical protein
LSFLYPSSVTITSSALISVSSVIEVDFFDFAGAAALALGAAAGFSFAAGAFALGAATGFVFVMALALGAATGFAFVAAFAFGAAAVFAMGLKVKS